MSHKALFSDSLKASDADRAEGAIVLQLILQILGDDMPEEIWKVIFQTAIERLQSTQTVKHQFVYGRYLQ